MYVSLCMKDLLLHITSNDDHWATGGKSLHIFNVARFLPLLIELGFGHGRRNLPSN